MNESRKDRENERQKRGTNELLVLYRKTYISNSFRLAGVLRLLRTYMIEISLVNVLKIQLYEQA